MLVNGNYLLGPAHEHHFAIPAFNSGSGQLFTETLEECERLQAPFIMAIHPNELKFVRDSFVGQVLQAANHTDLPIVIHLDHGATYGQAIHAIHLGFTSVMIDASLKPFEENVAITREVVRAAHATGVTVEAELGTIADTGTNIPGHLTDNVKYTDPQTAHDFVEQTGVDSLAVAIGTAHGLYPKDVKPKLRPEIVSDIAESVDVPLVLHGASNNPDDEIRRAIHNGINKINISSDLKVAFAGKLKDFLDNNDYREVREPMNLFPEAMKEARIVVREKVELCENRNTKKLILNEGSEELQVVLPVDTNSPLLVGVK